ncbi:MAG: flagellar filament capping protein FliD [Planctomycetes bacterium]|nr:flagellar filament capping protein FliD [Planctomycetota bacterium]
MSSLSPTVSLSNLLSNTPLSVSGLATGFDTEKIIQGLTAIQQKRIDLIQSEESVALNRQKAFKGVEAQLLTFQGLVKQLGQAQNNVFGVRAVSSSNEDLVTAAATSSAVPGRYTLTVNSLAQNDQVASQGYDSADAQITQGTLQLALGTGASKTITINDSNHTLQGLANAINAAGADVTASVINVGSGAHPFRLLLSSNKTGLSNALTITNSLGADAGNAVKPIFATQVQQAADASVSVGSGNGQLTIQNASNQIDGLFPGITVNLENANPDQTVTLTVSADISKTRQAIVDFVKGFNDLARTIDDQVRYDPATGQAGVLLGNPQVTAIQDQIRDALITPRSGLNPKLNSLVGLGITSDDRGQLVINDAKLDDALNGRVSGVNLNDVQNLFAVGSSLSNPASVGAKVSQTLDKMLDPVSGRLRTIDDGFQSSIDDFKKQIDVQTQFLQDQTAQLQHRFAVLETTVSQLQNIGNLLNAQFAVLSKSK